jgi:hypothetical protein
LKGIDIDAKASGSIQVIVQRFADEVLAEDEPRTLDITPALEVEEPETKNQKRKTTDEEAKD